MPIVDDGAVLPWPGAVHNGFKATAIKGVLDTLDCATVVIVP
jgi:hypothetical protein